MPRLRWSIALIAGATAVHAGSDPYAWRSMFNGRDLTGWTNTGYVRPGPIVAYPDRPPPQLPTNAPAGPAIFLGAGEDLTGITWTGELPRVNYEVRLEAMRVSGGDFFCGLTFPVGTNHATLVVGGWGGTVVGISSLDGMDASENETSSFMEFQNGRWYEITLCVYEDRLIADIGDRRVVNVDIRGRRVHMRAGEIEEGIPFSISTWRTAGALRNIRIRALPPPPPAP
ncbi:MAG: DUF1080 domain-containing protein [Kiritimatiellae bacterium]|nr:DUF1080 domain-containing protein [Kiritimatiellia bacterium]